MSMLRAMSMKEHNYFRSGDYVKLGNLHSNLQAFQLRDIEEEYMMQRMYRGVLVDNLLEGNAHVYFQDCTFVRYASLGHRCRYFADKKCSYKIEIVKLPRYMIT